VLHFHLCDYCTIDRAEIQYPIYGRHGCTPKADQGQARRVRSKEGQQRRGAVLLGMLRHPLATLP
jgi:hypothetical protein